jgi:hypothetical protein
MDIRKHLIGIACVMIAAISLVSILGWTALRYVNKKSGFERNIVQPNIKLMSVMRKNNLVTNIAGNTNSHIYFKTKDPSTIFATNAYLQDARFIRLHVPNNNRVSSLFYCTVDSPFVYIMAGNVPAVFKTNINSGETTTAGLPGTVFTRSVNISSNTYVFRGFDKNLKSDQVFIKGNAVSGEQTTEKSISEKNHDAGFSTDGRLHFDHKTKRLVYVEFYKNRLICLDTNLNLIYRAPTLY